MKTPRNKRAFQPIGYRGKSKKWARRRDKAYRRKFPAALLSGEIGTLRSFRVLEVE